MVMTLPREEAEKALAAALADPKTPVEARLSVVAGMKSGALPPLLEHLAALIGSSEEPLRRAAREALTGRLGQDLGDGVGPWTDWLAAHRARLRVEAAGMVVGEPGPPLRQGDVLMARNGTPRAMREVLTVPPGRWTLVRSGAEQTVEVGGYLKRPDVFAAYVVRLGDVPISQGEIEKALKGK
jgi:hypothetical protein